MGNKKIKIIGAIAGAAVILTGLWLWPMSTRHQTVIRQIKVGNYSLAVEIADADSLKQLGLSNREILGEEAGMLFIYPDQQIRYFWMKDMKFNLDVLWLASGEVVGLQENIPFQSADGTVVRFHSNAPADMVLEVNAGWIGRHGIKTGDGVVQN